MMGVDIKRDLSLDFLRIIATFAVIILHVAAQKDYFEVAFPSDEWLSRLFYNSSVRWCVPVFVMISGALFLNPSKSITIRRLFKKNILRIFCAYFVWTVAYALYMVLSGGKELSLLPLFSLQGYGSFHLWFLKMILGLYIAVPILRYVAKDKTTELYFLCISLFVSFFIPFSLEILDHYNVILSGILKENISTMRLDIASGYTGYFVLGHYLNTYKVCKKSNRIMLYVFGLICIPFVLICTYLYSYQTGVVYDVLLGYLFPLTLVESIAIFLLFMSWGGSTVIDHCREVIVYTSKISFGIYLIHVFMLYALNDLFGIDSASFSPWLSIPLLSLIVFFMSYVIASVLYRIPLFNKYLM